MRQFAKAFSQHKAGEMNGLEKEYAQRLEFLKQTGAVKHFEFESVKLNLGNRCWYTPDFFVINSNQEIEFHETKGFMTDDALVKLKACAAKFPFRFYLVKKEKSKLVVKDMSCL